MLGESNQENEESASEVSTYESSSKGRPMDIQPPLIEQAQNQILYQQLNDLEEKNKM